MLRNISINMRAHIEFGTPVAEIQRFAGESKERDERALFAG